MALDKILPKVFAEIDEDKFVTFSNDRRFRVYVSPTAGLVELEQMDEDGLREDMVASCAFCVFGFDEGRNKQAALRFNGFLEQWCDHFDGDLDREHALQVFDHLVGLAKLSID